jgi:diguanylate cyclase (GGDEF)-like protein
MLDMMRRLRAVERHAAWIFLVALAVAAPSTGSLIWAPVVVGMACWWLLRENLDHFRRPELALLAGLAALELGLAVMIAVADGASIYLLPALIFPIFLMISAVPRRTGWVVVVLGDLLMFAVAMLFLREQVLQTPFALVWPMVCLVCGSAACTLANDLDVVIRGRAIVDQLTGLLNRAALQARVAELEHQAAIADRQVAVVIGDLDHFKLINDEHGHDTGDKVLREVGRRLRDALGGAIAAYRLGGEEFIVLLADCDTGMAERVAERLRQAVRSEQIAGLNVTMSIGVAATAPHETFSFARVFERADAALYRAKQSGRNRVAVNATLGADAGAGLSEVAPVSAPPALDRRVMRGLDPGDHRRRGDADLQVVVRMETAPQAAEESAGGDRWEEWNEQQRSKTGSLLIRDDMQRQHMLELNRYLRERTMPPFVLGFACALVTSFFYGWSITVLSLVGAVGYLVTELLADRFTLPEFWLGGAWLVMMLGMAAGAVLCHAPVFFAVTMVPVLSVAAAAVHPPRSVALGATAAAIGMIGVDFLMNAQFVLDYPAVLTLEMALVVSVGMLGRVIGESTMDHRSAGIVDQLTGMFNRNALDSRTAELAHRTTTDGDRVAVIVADLDRFKSINDVHGHAIGDAVLKEVAYRIRKSLRAFESAYRIGGEEFVVLLDQVDNGIALAIAERLHKAVSESPIAGIDVTMSFGVATSRPGIPFDYAAVFGRADEALYRAKRDGRDRVTPEDLPDSEPVTAASWSTLGTRLRGLVSH